MNLVQRTPSSLTFVRPGRVELGAEIGLEELGARNAVAVGQAQQAAFQADQARLMA
jgi:hypothetical protein